MQLPAAGGAASPHTYAAASSVCPSITMTSPTPPHGFPIASLTASRYIPPPPFAPTQVPAAAASAPPGCHVARPAAGLLSSVGHWPRLLPPNHQAHFRAYGNPTHRTAQTQLQY
ncbi:MAG: hypothetical protein AAF485_00155 [Chloroflexota bacterium]